MKEEPDFLTVLIITGLVVFIMGIAIFIGCHNGREMERKRLQQQAIDHGAAEYDAKTGQWQWKGPTP